MPHPPECTWCPASGVLYRCCGTMRHRTQFEKQFKARSLGCYIWQSGVVGSISTSCIYLPSWLRSLPKGVRKSKSCGRTILSTNSWPFSHFPNANCQETKRQAVAIQLLRKWKDEAWNFRARFGKKIWLLSGQESRPLQIRFPVRRRHAILRLEQLSQHRWPQTENGCIGKVKKQ